MRRGYLCILGLLLFAALSAGGKGESSSAEKQKKDTLVVATGADATTLDPYATNNVPSSNAMRQIYDTLVGTDHEGKITYDLAEKVEQEGSQFYRFTLRKGVKFHNGEELKAEDAVFSLKRAYNEGPSIRHLVNMIDIDTVKVESDYVFSLRLIQPYGPFLSSLAHMGGGAVLNKKAVEEEGEDYAFHPVGTGPYRLVDWRKNHEMTLERFDQYWGPAPYFKKMIIRVIPESSSRVLELEAGTVDLAFNLSALEMARVEKEKGLAVTSALGNSITYLGLNTQRPPLDNKLLRQAISHAIDIKAATAAVFKGLAEPAAGVLPSTIPYYDKEATVPEYNPEKAKKMLAEAGYPNGLTLDLWTNSRKERVDMATIIKEQLKAVGITANLEVLEWGAYLQKLTAGVQQLFIIGWTTQANDPDIGLYPAFHSTGGSNRAFLRDPEVDKLIDRERALPNGPERKKIVIEAQRRIVDDTPWVPLAVAKIAFGHSSHLKGFYPDPRKYYKLFETYWE